ncbi:hypothetical protein CANMA_003324 [Candida margitis]|uniref:uncharacterized protein n=1 Tax=Candida margitis TaxID=1775924 RepID=UPI00222616DA|nr:uncharacterized protein CANMA_003324 [Candida margitis]KAI5966078.1 hypothetical protein CANMA_003324 [Candida margitis]
MQFHIALFYLIIGTLAATIKPTKPSDDDFYTPPQGYEDQEVGTILKRRNTPSPLTSVVNQASVQNSWQLLVRSEDSFGNPNAIATTIIQPFNASNDKVVSYQSFQDSGKLDCAISFAIQYGSGFDNLLGQAEMFFISAFLTQGYYVVVPDHEGPKSTFTAGRQSGKATLNSIRATLNSENTTGIHSGAQVMMWGYSGGSLASGWAAVLQKEYAPELSSNLIGAALGGFYSNLTALFDYTDGTIYAGLVPNALGGIGNEYTNVSDFLNHKVSSDDAEQFSERDDYCITDSTFANLFRNYFSGSDKVFPDGWGIFNEEPLKSTMEENGLVYLSKDYVPQIPIFIYHATNDDILPFRDSNETFSRWCEWGLESGEFNEDQTYAHITEALVGAPAALTWVIDRFNGVPPVQGCKHTARVSNFDYPGIASSIFDYFSSILDMLMGSELGPFLE